MEIPNGALGWSLSGSRWQGKKSYLFITTSGSLSTTIKRAKDALLLVLLGENS